jgi:transcriptional regulator
MCTLVLGVMVRARGKTRKLLERQLRSESANVSYLMERVLEDNISDQDSVLNTLRRTAYIPAKKTSKARQFKNKVKKKKNRH